MNPLETETPQVVHQPTNSVSDNTSHNTSKLIITYYYNIGNNFKSPIIHFNSNSEFAEDKIETIYFTNNIINENIIEKNQHQNRNTTDSVFYSSYDFLQVSS